MFDNHTDPDIWQACQFVCERCPALSDCEQWVTSLKPSQRPFGVTAGQLRQPRQRKDHAA